MGSWGDGADREGRMTPPLGSAGGCKEVGLVGGGDGLRRFNLAPREATRVLHATAFARKVGEYRG